MIKFPKSINKILVTGGSGFIGTTLVEKLIRNTNIQVYNLDKLGYASNSSKFLNSCESNRYVMLKVDLCNEEDTENAVKLSNPDLVFHLAAESHVDRSIVEPKTFIDNNIIGTFNLLKSLNIHWQRMEIKRKKSFRVLHVSTDEVFGSLFKDESFSEKSPYDPRNPYSATKAASDHLVRTWNNTYGLPTLITHSSNNYGPYQHSEKLIPTIINNALSKKEIPIYGDGKNIRDWIYVEDHVDALIQVILQGKVGQSYCIGSENQKTNLEIVETICEFLDVYIPHNSPHIRFLKLVDDRKGHDRKYAINNRKIKEELNWMPKYDFKKGISRTIKWYQRLFFED
mgnify:CR=1 FL=1